MPEIRDPQGEQITELIRRHWDDLAEHQGRPTHVLLKEFRELIEQHALGLISRADWKRWRRLLDRYGSAIHLRAWLEFLEHQVTVLSGDEFAITAEPLDRQRAIEQWRKVVSQMNQEG